YWLGGPVPAVATVLSCRTRWPPIDACGRRVGVWIGLFGPSCWRFDANLTPCCGYRGINPHFVAEISTELSRTVKYCPDIHNTVGLGYLQPVDKKYLSTICRYPGSGEGNVSPAYPRGLDDAPSHARRSADHPQGDSLAGEFPKIDFPTGRHLHGLESASPQARRGASPSEARPQCGVRITQDRKSTRLNSSHVSISYA